MLFGPSHSRSSPGLMRTHTVLLLLSVLLLFLLLFRCGYSAPQTYTVKVWDESPVESSDVRYKPYVAGNNTMTAYWSFGTLSQSSVSSCLAGIGVSPTNVSVVPFTSIGVKTSHSFSKISVPPRQNLNFVVKCTLIDSSTAQGVSSGVTFDDTPPLPGIVEIVDSSDPSLDSPKIEYQQFSDEISAVWTHFVENDTSHPVIPTFDCIVKTSTNGQCQSYFGYNNAESSAIQATAGSELNRFVNGPSTSYAGQPSLFEPGVHKFVFSVVHPCSEVRTWKLDSLSVSTEWNNVETCPIGCDGVRLSGATKDACGVCKGTNITCTRIEPFVSCVRVFPNKTCSASFGYYNRGPYTAQIDAGTSDNRFDGALTSSGNQGQPTIFYKGRYSAVVEVLFDCSSKYRDLDWYLDGRKASATSRMASKRKYICKGCDGVRGSTKVRDRCGVCGGDGSSCASQPTRFDNGTALNIGIVKYEVALGSSATDTTSSLVVPFTDVGVTNRYTFSDLSLQNKRYFVHVRAFNQAGLTSLVTSNPVQVDTTPPIAGTVYDGTQLRTDAKFQSSLTEIAANWPDVIDPDSGIDSYTFGVGTTPGEYDVMPETAVGTATSYKATGLALQTGTTYYINIVATNNAGLETDELSSNGITVIANPPEAGTIYDGLEFEKDASFQSSQNTIAAHWTGFRDNYVGIREFRCGVGTSSSSPNVVGFVSVGLNTSYEFQLPAGTLLQHGVKYFFLVQAINNILLSTTTASNGITIDSTPPIPGVLQDGNGATDFNVQTSTTTFTGQWTAFSDPETGIKEYRCGLSSDSTGNPNIAALRTVSSDMRLCTFTNLKMPLGSTYYFVVEGVNSVGNSIRAVSNGVSIIASRGTCNDIGECVCDDGWSGPFCSIGISNVLPVVNCWVDNCNGTNTAYFGYSNQNPDVITIPAGPNNKITPASTLQSPPTFFNVGRFAYQLNITHNAAVITWQIGQTMAMASLKSVICPWQTMCQTVPGIPTNLTQVAVNAGSVSLVWSAPNSDGGAVISDYRITYSSAGASSRTILVGSSRTSVTVPDLAYATTYTFTVAAKNSAGFSAESAPLSSTTSPIVPSAPSALAASLINSTTIDLVWTAPTSNGGAAITNYRITYSTASTGAVATALVGGASTFYTLRNLIPGKQYSISVSAQNSAGWSAESTPITPVTLTTPGYPQMLRAVNITSSSISLTWEPPTTNGGATITDYRISFAAQGSSGLTTTTTIDGTLTSFTIPSLNPGTAYNVTIAAKNSVGFSEESTAVLITTLPVVPSSPGTLSVANATSSSLTLTWTSPAYSGGAVITNYRITYSTSNAAPSIVIVAQVTTTSLLNLQPGTLYTLTIAAKNAAGWSSESSPISSTTMTTVPSAPTNLTGSSVTSSSVFLSWTVPSRNGGAPITDYQITFSLSRNSAQTVLTNSSSTSFLLEGLQFASHYTITVAAVNSQGISDQSAAVWITTQATTPTAPLSLAASSVTSTSASLSWEAPTSDGGSSIEKYRITFSATGQSPQIVIAGGTCTSYGISDLLRGTEYTVTVAAVNNVGPSPESAPVTFTTQTVPSPPTSVSAGAITSTSISVFWSAPLFDGLTPILDYRVTLTPTGSSPLISFVGSTSTSLLLSGLTPGKQYTITVSAKNKVGYSQESDAISATTDAVVPEIPTNLAISSVTSNSLVLSWSAPQFDGGSAIVDFRITYTPSDDIPITVLTGGVVFSFTLSGLDPGVEYSITVAAQNGIGFSNESAVAILTTSATTPGKPLSLSASSITSGTITLEWSAPVSDGGSALTDYLIMFGRSGDTVISLYVGSSATTFTLTALLSGTEYTVTVVAVNPLGSGPPSDVLTVSTMDGPPSAPTNLAITSVQTDSVSLSWNAPEWDGGDNITEYRITYLVSGGPSVETLTGNADLEFVLTNLQPGTQYSLSIAAKNGAGFSEGSPSVQFTTLIAVPSAPDGLNASSVTKNSIQLDWNAPSSNGGGALSHYRISSSSFVVFISASTTSHTIVDLASGVSFTITVAVNNSAGWSPESTPISPTTLAVPSQPANISISLITSSSMTVSWDVPEWDGGTPITSYLIYYQAEDQSASAVTTSNVSSVIIMDLSAGTTYTISVVAKNGVGISSPSDSVAASTLAVPPNAPQSLVAAAVSGNGIDLSWEAPSYTGGASVSDYRITFTASGNNVSMFVHIGSPVTAFSLSGLTQATEYVITVAAANQVGFGPESDPAVVTTWDVPSAPQSVSILFVTSRTLVLGWSGPAFLGGDIEITDYRISWTNAETAQTLTNQTGSGAINEFDLTDLVPNTVYIITVSAANSVGFGPESDPISSTTNIELPGVPWNLRASDVRSSSLNFSWNEPLWTGGAALTDYAVIFVATIQGYTGMFVVFTGSGTETSVILDHLEPDTEYAIIVAAKNPLGYGENSEEIVVVRTLPEGAIPNDDISYIAHGHCFNSNDTCVCSTGYHGSRCEQVYRDITPVLITIIPNGDGTSVAWFGYENTASFVQNISAGTSNFFSPPIISCSGLPDSFPPGSYLTVGQAGTVSVLFDEDQGVPVWFLGSSNVSSSRVDNRGYILPNGTMVCLSKWFGPDCSIGMNNVVPSLVSVVSNGDGTSKATFSLISTNVEDIEIPIGPFNYFEPAPSDRGQPTVFIGNRTTTVSITFNDSDPLPIWHLGSNVGGSRIPNGFCLPDGTCDCIGSATCETAIQQVTPIFLKIVPVLGTEALRAYFGYQNLHPHNVTIPIGDRNRVVPSPQNQQPTVFRSGLIVEGADVFYVEFSGSELPFWTLGNTTTQAVLMNNTDPDQPEPPHGFCDESQCTCFETWSGPDCSLGVINVAPIVTNVSRIGSTSRSRAYYGYINNNTATITIPVGMYNYFVPSPQNRGQVVEFAPGRADNVFFVEFETSLGIPIWFIGAHASNESHVNFTDNHDGDLGGNTEVPPDTTPPLAGLVLDGPISGTDVLFTTSTDSLFATWSGFSDPESGIKRYLCAAGTTPFGTDVANLVNVGRSTTCSFRGLSLTESVRYYILVQAVNGEMLATNVSSNGIVVEMSPPIPGTIFNGPTAGVNIEEQYSNSSLDVNWSGFSDPESGISHYRCGVTTILGFNDQTVPLTSVAQGQTSCHFSSVSLGFGNTYFFVIEAQNGAGMKTLAFSGALSVIQPPIDNVSDTTPPIAGTVYDGTDPTKDLEFQTNNASSLSGVWFRFRDPNSGIRNYQVGVGTSSSNPNVVPFTDVGLVNMHTFTNLSLTNGVEYFFIVKAFNRANLSTTVSSNGVIIDMTPPINGTVFHGLENGKNLLFQVSSSSISAYWTGFQDPESGIRQYRCGVGTSPDKVDFISWTDVGTSTRQTFPSLSLTQSVKYYFIVEATNGAGMTSTVSSSGVTVDYTPPVFSFITPDVMNDEPSISYSNRTSSFGGNWSAFDPETDISEYYCGIGTKSTTADLVPLQSVGLNRQCEFSTPGGVADLVRSGFVYYLIVEAVNGAGVHTRRASKQVFIDSTPPNGTVNHGLQSLPSGEDVRYQVMEDTLSARWNISDEDSGVLNYQFGIGTSRFSDDLLPFQDVGLVNFFTAINLVLKRNTVYYVAIRAFNRAMAASVNSPSTGIRIGTAGVTTSTTETTKVTITQDKFDMDLEVPPGLLPYPVDIVARPLKSDDFATDPTLEKPSRELVSTAFSNQIPASSNLIFTLNAFGEPEEGQPNGTLAFQEPLTIKLSYQDGDLDEKVDPSALSLMYWDPDDKSWHLAKESCPTPYEADFPDQKLHVVNVCHFTQFALFGKNTWAPYLMIGGVAGVIGIVMFVILASVLLLTPFLLVFALYHKLIRYLNHRRISPHAKDEAFAVVPKVDANRRMSTSGVSRGGGRGGGAAGRGGAANGGSRRQSMSASSSANNNNNRRASVASNSSAGHSARRQSTASARVPPV